MQKPVKTRQTISSWHHLSLDKIYQTLESTPDGLSTQIAKERLTKHGSNRLPEAAKTSPWKRLLLQFHNILIYVLIGSSLITALLEHWFDTGVILAVVFANALIGFIQEGKAEKAMDAIRQMLAQQARVIRDGVQCSIPGDQLVVGDVVMLEAGDKVPADLRIVKSHGLQAQEAILTGESVPVEKNNKPAALHAALGDRACMAYSGTLVTSGQGKGIVVATGAHTEIGRISGLLKKVEVLTTPLVQQMDRFAKWLTIFILLIAALILLFGYYVAHYDFTYIFMAVVGLSVAAIPEGLPAVLTITLAVGVQAMARRNTIVRRLPAIETLGSVSVICSDKTGTLTRNEMMVTSILTSSAQFTLDGSGYQPIGVLRLNDAVIDTKQHAVLSSLARASALCNNAALHEHEGIWTVDGDPMEGALLTFAGKLGFDIRGETAAWARTDLIPFDAKHRFMATLNHNHEQHAFIFVKGSPERILSMCQNQQSSKGTVEALDSQYWHEKAHQIALQGQRVLAFAIRQVDPTCTVLEHQDVEGKLTLLGMVGMIDPPRPEVVDAIASCVKAGIRVKMITGDHAGTAMAIGKQINLQHPDRVLTGVDIDKMSDSNLKEAILDTDIFARTGPEHKLRLVMALQAHGLTVAMTGDGVNDAPALKRADAGVAMGKKGSEAAKEAAELVLVDDNFASIVAAIREGRTVYDNIKKVISWMLPTNAGEAMTVIVALLLGMKLPVSPIQILWVNLITAITLGLALAFEPTEENTMQRPPRPRNESLLSGHLIWHIILVSSLFLCGVYGIYAYAIDHGYSEPLAQTIALNTLVVMEIFHLFFIRNIYSTSLNLKAIRGTKVVWTSVILITIAQFAVTYVPVLQKIFGTVSVPLWDGFLIVWVGVMLFIIIEIEKQIRLGLRKPQGGRHDRF